ncbi:MAG: DUF3662 domain-containing protein [Blastocatellia bacterium]|nr:DUF3662 domain-containing protein [Blastocatellia bacterium]
MGLKNLIGDFRKWLDGEDAASLAPEAPPARREWEEFLVSVAREVETAMQREMFTPPGGPTYIPREYLVFLSKADDSQWQGDKREGLQRGLYHVLSERAKELISDKDVQTKSFAIELRVDGTLEKGQFRVQPVWDSTAPKTEVKPRQKVAAPTTPVADPEETITAPLNTDSPATLVRPRAPLFMLEFSRDGEASETFPCHKPQISIGRGAKDIQVDLRLDGDLEISRKQATIERLADGRFAITCEGRNALEVAGREVTQGDRVEFEVGEAVRVGIYRLRCQLQSSSVEQLS